MSGCLTFDFIFGFVFVTLAIALFPMMYMVLERPPLIFRRWRVRIVSGDYYNPGVQVVVKRGDKSVAVGSVTQTAVDFDERLATLVSDARARAISLNGASKHANRKLPA